MLCLPELNERFLFQVAATRFYGGERVPVPDDARYLCMQSILGNYFDRAFLGNPSVFSMHPALHSDYQHVFALYWEMRMGQG